MHSPAFPQLTRLLTSILPVLILAGCGQGDGPISIQNRPATPLPPIPEGFCDPINFEILCDPVEIINFNGGATTIIDNPDSSGINTSERVARMQKFPDQPFGGTLLDTGAPYDFGEGEAFTVKVWATRSVPLTFKLDQQNIERVLSHSGSGEWEELCFDFTGSTTAVPNPGLTLIFQDGTLGQADTDPDNWTFFYDDILQVESCPGGPVLPPTWSTITFDDPSLTYGLAGFGGGDDSALVADPDDASNQVARLNRSDSAETFAGVTVSLGPNQAVPVIPLDTANPLMNVRVRGPAMNVPIRLKIENASDSNVSVETEALTNVADAWETLSFDFAMQASGTAAFDPAATYNKITIFPNFGADGATAGAQTYYFDDFAVGAGPGGGGGGGDHGAGTAAVYTETTTESTVTVAGIVNSIDFGGNNTVADPNSTAIPAFEGSVALSIDYQDSGSTFGGALLDFGGVDLTAYDTLNFTIDTSAITGFADLTIQIEPPGAGAAGTNVALSAYTPVATSGNWATYQIPLADFTATNFGAAANLGFWNARDGGGALVFGTLYVDDVYFSTEGSGGGGGGGSGGPGEQTVNGDVEAGDLSGFEIFPGGGTITADNTENNTAGGTWSIHAVAGPGNNPVIKQERRAAGTVMPNQQVTLSFDMKGTAAAGGVVFAELFSEGAGGAVAAQLLDTIPAPTADWTTYTYTPNVAADVTDGITFQIAVVCGADAACTADVFVDNISIVVN